VAKKPEPAPPQLPLVESPAAVELKPEPLIEKLSVVEPAPVAQEPVPVPGSEPVLAVEATPVAVAEALRAELEPEPLAEQIPQVEATPVATEPEPVAVVAFSAEQIRQVEATPVATQPEPVAAEAISAAQEPEPVAEQIAQIEAAPIANEPEPAAAESLATEPEPAAEQVPQVEAAPVATEPEPVAVEALAAAPEPEPVAEQIPQPEASSVATESAPAEQAAEPAAVAEPLAEPIPQLEATPRLAAPEPEPVAAAKAESALVADATVPAPAPVVDLKPPIQEPAPESPIKLHEVPDPLFALAVEIRAVQAARAAALAAPQESSGLLELAEAVGTPPAPVEQTEPVEQPKPAEQAELVAHSVPPSAPEKIHAAEAALAAVEAATAVALLAPPEPEKTLLMEPIALAPVPQPVAQPKPVPQPQPVALAPEPQTEPEGPTLPFAPMQDYTPATSRSIMPVPPRAQILSADSGPRITLPGPTLPPELTRLQDANVVTVIGEQTAQRAKEAVPPAKRGGAPGWLVSALVMIVLLSAGLAVVYFLLLPRTVADAKPSPTPAVAASTPAPTGGSSPLAKFVEVTGFRIITSSGDANKKSEVQYLVVNHSDADISDANVFITLRSAKPEQAPLCRFSFKIPSLGPFESKEMSSPIEKSPRAITLPDWQDLRADVQISQ